MFRPLEDHLAALTHRRHCVVTGRGASAIWLALEAFKDARPDGTRVVLPVTLCTSPAAVTHHAGLVPVFCDTEPASGNLCPAALERLLETRRDVLCVLAAHLYGEPADMVRIAEICTRFDVFLIEDAAQSLGAKGVGQHGDVTILSFGHTKIIDAGGGGAALTCDAGLDARLREFESRLGPKPRAAAQWAADYRSTYYGAQAEWAANPAAKRRVGDICKLHPGLYLHRLDEAQAGLILAALDALPAEVNRRRERAKAYDEAFRGIGRPLQRSPDGVPWRYGLMLPPAHRDAAVEALRSAGVDASCWYPRLAPFFGDEGDFPGGEAIEAGVVNLWVDDRADDARIAHSAALVRDVLTGAGTNGIKSQDSGT